MPHNLIVNIIKERLWSISEMGKWRRCKNWHLSIKSSSSALLTSQYLFSVEFTYYLNLLLRNTLIKMTAYTQALYKIALILKSIIKREFILLATCAELLLWEMTLKSSCKQEMCSSLKFLNNSVHSRGSKSK